MEITRDDDAYVIRGTKSDLQALINFIADAKRRTNAGTFWAEAFNEGEDRCGLTIFVKD
jgi:hypothetical protein